MSTICPKTCYVISGKLALLALVFLTGLGSMPEAAAVAGEGDVIDYTKYGRKGAKARKARLNIPEKHYDPTTTVYVDALWMRVHEADCPALIMKDLKETMTLEEADKAGYRIGETGQSGRSHCCFHGYRRKYPEKEFTSDSVGIVQKIRNGTRMKWHQAGCHRFSIGPNHVIMTQREAEEAAAREGAYFYVCTHCIERGPGNTMADLEALKERPTPPTFTPPAGWTPEPLSPDELPSKQEIDILVQETLATGDGIQEAPYENPVASLEEFVGRRFFFGGYNVAKAYRATGDKRLLDKILVTARHYNQLCEDYPSVAQYKARDPEGLNFMADMAISSRIIMQLARKDPSSITWRDFMEAEAFLKSIVATLEPTLEGDDNLDPEMGIPQELADDFRSRAWNRAMNGIGTIGMAAAALEDLQALNQSQEYQPTIDRYHKVIGEYLKLFKSVGCLYTESNGKDYFYYPYGTSDTGRLVSGFKLYNGPEDQGHYSHTVQGFYLLYDSVPELGVDDDFMTAVGNAVYHNSMTRKHGSIQCPSADRRRPKSRKSYGAAQKRFYMLEAFTDDIIDGQCVTLSRSKTRAVNSSYGHRLETLHIHYMKALRQDPTLVHLGEKIGPLMPSAYTRN